MGSASSGKVRYGTSSPAKQAPHERTLPAETAGFRTVRLGMCEDYPEQSSHPDEIRRDMRLLTQTGLRVLRISVAWGDVHPGQGHYRWAFLDEFIRIAVDEFALTLIPYVCYTPQWNAQEKARPDFWRCPPEDYEQFAVFMRELSSRYRGRIHSWELWNEPDNRDFWTGSMKELARLIEAGARGVRQGDPSARIVLGGIAWNIAYLAGLFRDHAIGQHVDVVNLHNYYETWVDEPAERIVDYINRASDVIAQYGNHQPLWMAEIGYSTFRRGSHVSDQCSAYFAYEHTPEYQANHLVRMMAAMLSTEKLHTIAWYELRELPPAASVIGDVNNRHLGLTGTDLTAKPALSAAAFIAQLTSAPHRCIDDQATLLRSVRSDSHVHCFERHDGSILIVAWLKTLVYGQRQQRANGQCPDERQETIELTLPLANPAQARIYDARAPSASSSPSSRTAASSA